MKNKGKQKDNGHMNTLLLGHARFQKIDSFNHNIRVSFKDFTAVQIAKSKIPMMKIKKMQKLHLHDFAFFRLNLIKIKALNLTNRSYSSEILDWQGRFRALSIKDVLQEQSALIEKEVQRRIEAEKVTVENANYQRAKWDTPYEHKPAGSKKINIFLAIFSAITILLLLFTIYLIVYHIN